MPIRPGKSENESEFISRCMSVEKDSFPDEPQRYAVCKSMWDRQEMSKPTKMSASDRIAQKLAFEKKYEGINLQEGLEGACWPGWKALGTKELSGKTVPNCIREEDHPDYQ